MADLNILITTYHEAFLNRGGGEIELNEVAYYLNQLGHRADIYGPQSCSIDKYDAVLHFSMHGGGLPLIKLIKRKGKKIILWPNLWWTEAPTKDELSQKYEFIEYVDAIVFKSVAEKSNFSRWIDIPEEKICIVPSGVDECYRVPADRDMFKTIYEVDDYILWIGIIEEIKNQLFCIEALRDIDIPVVFIGNYREKAYFNRCRELAPKHFKFLPHMPAKSEILRSAIQNCRVYLEAPLDHPGLSALEAGLAGVPLVFSNDSWSIEHFENKAVLIDPNNKESIKSGVSCAIEKYDYNKISDEICETHLYPSCLKPLVDVLSDKI